MQINKLFLSCLLFLILPLSTHAASVDPAIDWKVIETENFKIIYDAKLRTVGRLYAWQAERAHYFLQPIFKETPGKTHVLISDNTDFANGYAGFLPLPLITVFPVMPGNLDSISHYDNWAAELMIHEYTHILTFEPAHGIYSPFKYIFGNLIHPTGLLPSWWQEGLAVEMETRFTKHGRLRSPGYGANLRNLVVNQQLRQETLDRVNEGDIPTWPFGQRPYLFGSLIWNKIIEESGVEVAPTLLQSYSRRVPFLLNAPLQNSASKTYQQILGELYQEVEQRVAEQLEKIADSPENNQTPLNHSGTGQHSPAISPNQKYLAYLAFVPKQTGQIRLVERNPKSKESFSGKSYSLVKKSAGTSRLAWLPDSSGFIFDQAKAFNRYYRFRDLYHYDLASKKTHRLTHGLRATEADVSPDGKSVIFVQIGPATSQISQLNLEDKSVTTIYKPKGLQSRVSRPIYTSASNIVFGLHNSRGEEGLMAMDVRNKRARIILKDLMPVRQAKATPSGLLVVSDKSGVSNLYAANDLLSTGSPLTNSKTEVLNGEWDSLTNEVIFSQLTAEGPKLFLSPKTSLGRLPKIEPLIADLWDPPNSGPQLSEVQMSEKDFSSWPYLYPRYWIPFLYPVEGGVLFQGTTSAGDPLGKHTYALDASYDTVTKKPSYGVSYLNGVSSIDWSLFYSESQDYLAGFDLTLTNRAAGASTGFYLPWLSDRWRGNLGGVYIETESLSSKFKRQGPTTSFSYSTFTSGEDGSESSEEDQTSDYNTQVSIGHTEYLKGEQYLDYGRSSLTWNQVITKWLPPGHSLVTQLRGAYAPELGLGNVTILGDKTVGGNYIASLVTSSFLMRGYPSTAFVGRKIVNGNFEYRFPMADIYKGKGLMPVFLKDLHASFFIDGVAVDGGVFDPEISGYKRVELDKQFWAAGAELKLTTTMAYQFPVTFIFGAYYGFDQEMQGGFHPFLGIGIGGISDLNHRAKVAINNN